MNAIQKKLQAFGANEIRPRGNSIGPICTVPDGYDCTKTLHPKTKQHISELLEWIEDCEGREGIDDLRSKGPEHFISQMLSQNSNDPISKQIRSNPEEIKAFVSELLNIPRKYATPVAGSRADK